MSNVKCQMSNDIYQMSNVKCQMTNDKCQMSNVKCQMSNIKCQMSNAKSQQGHFCKVGFGQPILSWPFPQTLSLLAGLLQLVQLRHHLTSNSFVDILKLSQHI